MVKNEPGGKRIAFSPFYSTHNALYWIQKPKKAVSQERGVCMEYRLKVVNGHIEVFDLFGRFLFSADTEQEALQDLRAGSAA